MSRIIYLHGGPTYRINVRGKIYHFEDHKYCGPIATRADGEALKHQPMKFLETVTHWVQQGRRTTKDGVALFEWPARWG